MNEQLEGVISGIEPIKVLLVDDQPAVRRGLRMRLSLEPDIVVIGEASDGEEGVALARTLDPDVVVMDALMPQMDGISATTAIRQEGLGCAVVVLSLYDDARTQADARTAGAAVFIDKYSGAEALVAGIRQAAAKGGPRGRARREHRRLSPFRASRPARPGSASARPWLAGL